MTGKDGATDDADEDDDDDLSDDDDEDETDKNSDKSDSDGGGSDDDAFFGKSAKKLLAKQKKMLQSEISSREERDDSDDEGFEYVKKSSKRIYVPKFFSAPETKQQDFLKATAVKVFSVKLYKLHGNMTQPERLDSYGKFLKSKGAVLICTDVGMCTVQLSCSSLWLLTSLGQLLEDSICRELNGWFSSTHRPKALSTSIGYVVCGVEPLTSIK